jgi:transposase
MASGTWMHMLMENDSNTSLAGQEGEEQQQVPELQRKRGVKRGSIRGKYEKSSEVVRARIIAVSECGNDWSAVAAANGVRNHTAYNWVRNESSIQKPRGGKREGNGKINEMHVEAMVEMLNENPLLTLSELAGKLLQGHNVSVSRQTIARHLEGRLITLKNVHAQPEDANILRNRLLRKEYVQRIMAATGIGKYIVYIDESNVNLFLRRSQGRAPVGSRAVMKLPSSKGANIHMIGALTQTGIISFQRRRGNYKHQHCNAWLRELLQSIVAQGIQSHNIAIVIDNAPCHSRAEEAVAEFPGAELLRLAPYSPMLNPIESAWGVMKAVLKQKEAAQLPHLLAGPPANSGLTKTEWRLRFVEGIIDEVRQSVTPLMCMHFVNHTQAFFADALNLHDINVGQ